MRTLASTIRNRTDTLAKEYDRRLRAISGYAEMPHQDRLEAARRAIQLIAAGLEAEDDTQFTQFLQTVVAKRVAQGFEIESVQRALTALGEVLQPLVTTVKAANFLWRAMIQAHTTLSQAAMERVRASETKFKFLADNIAVGVFIHQDGLVRYVGREGARLLGYDSPDELLGRSILDFVHPSERERIADIARRRVAGEPVPDQYETRLLKKDGAAIDVLMYGALTEYEGRGATQGAFVEITERKQAEETLRQQRTRTETLYEISRELNAASDEDELLHILARPAWEAGVGRANLLYIDLDEAGEPEWIEMVAAWNREGTPPSVPVGSRFYLPEFPFSRLWLASPDELQLVADVTTDERVDESTRNLLAQTGSRAMAVVPLTQAGLRRERSAERRWVGLITLIWYEPHEFSDQEAEIYKALIGLGSPAVASRRWLVEVEENLQETQVRLEVSQALASAQTEDEVLDALIQQAGIYPEAQVVFSLYDPEAEEPTLVVKSTSSFESGLAPVEIGARFPTSRFKIINLLVPGEPFVVSDLATDERFDPPNCQYFTGLGNVSLLIITIAAGDERIGILRAGSSEEGFFDDKHKQHLYQTLAEQGAVALQAARLRDALSLTQFTVDRGPDAIFWIRPDATLAYVNDTACEMLGYSREELLSMAVFDFDPNFPREIWADHWQEIKKRQGSSIETQQQTKSGRLLPVEVVVNYLEYGGQEYHCAFARDITERKRAEEALLRSEERFRDLFESANDLIQSVAPDGSFLYVNRVWREALGYSEEEISNLSVFDIVHPDNRAHCMEIFQRVMAGESIDRLEAMFVTRDGRTITVEGSANCNFEDGIPVATRGIFRDITERKQAEESLLRLERAVEQSIDGIAMADMDGNIQFVNPAWAQMHDYGVEELLGRHLSIFHTKEQLQEEVFPFNERVMEAGFHWGEVGHVRRDGTIFPTWMATTLLKDEKGDPVGLVGTARDITERKRLEETQAYFSRLHSQFSSLLTNLLSPGPLAAKLQQVTDWIVEYMGADFCRLWIIQEGDLCDECMHAQVVEDGPHICLHRDRCLHLKTSSGRYTHIDGKVHRRVPFGAYKIGRVAAGDDLKFLTNDAQNDPRIHNLEWARELGLVSFAGYKLSTLEGEILGVLALFSQQVISPEEDAFLESVAGATSLVIHAAALEEESIRLAKAREIELHQIAQRRAEEVQTSTEVAQEIAASPALDELFHRVVTLVKERFGYYHAQLFLLSEEGDKLVTVAAYGKVGKHLLTQGHFIPMGKGVVGRAGDRGQPLLSPDVSQDPEWIPHPLLPDTTGEMAVPIKLRRMENGEWRDKVLGVLDVQSDIVGALTEEDQLLLEGLCGQIAIAIEDTRLRQEMEESLRELEHLYRAMSREGWETLRRKAGPTGYLFDRTGVITAGDFWVPEIGLAMEQQALVPPTSDGQPVAVTPLSVRGEIIGALGVRDDPQHSLSPEDLVLVESVSEQVALALESARLFEQTQEALAETRTLYEASRVIAEASTTKEILQAIVDNVIATDVDRCSVFFNNVVTGKVEWMEMAAVWDRAGIEGMPIGTRYPVEQFPIIRLLSKDKLFVANNAAEDEQLGAMAREMAERLQAQSFALIPLATPEHWLGLLMITCRSPHTFTERELRLYQSVADRAAIAIENRRLLEQTRAQARRERLIREITGQVQRSVNLDTILQTTVQELGKALGTSHALIRLSTPPQLTTEQECDIIGSEGTGGREREEKENSPC